MLIGICNIIPRGCQPNPEKRAQENQRNLSNLSYSAENWPWATLSQDNDYVN